MYPVRFSIRSSSESHPVFITPCSYITTLQVEVKYTLFCNFLFWSWIGTLLVWLLLWNVCKSWRKEFWIINDMHASSISHEYIRLKQVLQMKSFPALLIFTHYIQDNMILYNYSQVFVVFSLAWRRKPGGLLEKRQWRRLAQWTMWEQVSSTTAMLELYFTWVVWAFHTFENNFGMKHKFAKTVCLQIFFSCLRLEILSIMEHVLYTDCIHCRYSGVYHGRGSEVLFHGDEHPSAGWAPCYGDGHRHRPGGVATQGTSRSFIHSSRSCRKFWNFNFRHIFSAIFRLECD